MASKKTASNSTKSIRAPFVALPKALVRPSNPITGEGRPALDGLSVKAYRTLFFLMEQYNGRNNGDLSIGPKVCAQYGIHRTTARDGAAELAYRGLIVETRQGSKNVASLFALTWLGIDESDKYDDSIAPSEAPLDLWRPQLADRRTQHLVREHEQRKAREAERHKGRWLNTKLPRLHGKLNGQNRPDLPRRHGKQGIDYAAAPRQVRQSLTAAPRQGKIEGEH